MAETRRHYPAGATGSSQWAYELSLLTPEEQELIVLQSVDEEYVRMKQAVKEIVLADMDAAQRRISRNDPSKR